MGGDHKCPVCQATFTRPQHVARHMRSHTGDRPYKCAHCGDQFARSDLLSRHVNKCHANEKPLPTASNGRRRGSASLTRATTSKQACDQCVQSSLPCDGCNPCGKCVQRKCRCTYVKFHRQTAPSGPGHHSRSASSAARLSHADDFLLGPPPMNVQSMSDNLYSGSFNFPQISYPTPGESSAPALSIDNAPDFSAKYRAQAELLRRAASGVVPPATAGTNNVASITPGLYTDQQATSPWLGWTTSQPDQFLNDSSSLASRYLPPDDNKHNFNLDKELQATLLGQFLGHDNHYPSGPSGTDASAYSVGVGKNEHFSGGGPNIQHIRQRRGSAELGSDGSHGTASPSISSAASSKVHLPLPSVQQPTLSYNVGIEEQQQRQLQELIDSSKQNVGRMQGNYQPPLSQTLPQSMQQEGGFSSAFGQMSLEDPNVLAGLSNDAAPFFSNTVLNLLAQDPNTTPMPQKNPLSRDRSNTVGFPTPGPSSISREAETRQLREFWKAYVRTPLSGPGPSALDASGGPFSPNGMRRARVASLPSATPTENPDKQPSYPVPGEMKNGPNGVNGTSSLRTTLHGDSDDLRSYEAAVLARRAPTHLNLVPRRSRGNTASGSPQVPPPRPARNPNQALFEFSRPSSSSSTSSLAHAFGESQFGGVGAGGKGKGVQHVNFAEPLVRGIDLDNASSRASSEAFTDEVGSDQEYVRPSFKRLPSQTLGPANAKRAQLSREGIEEGPAKRLVGGGEDDTGEGRGEARGNNSGVDKSEAASPALGRPHRQILNLRERHRRMSEPTASGSTTPLG